MLKIVIKEGENIERAIKRYRTKYRNTKLIRELRERKNYTKPTTANRFEKKRAEYRNEKLLKSLD